MLNRAILSHLLVAVPPAAVLGAMVVDINGRTLRQESQQLHLSVASQLKDALAARVDETSLLLGHAERILDLAALSIDARKDLLRALVADQRLPQLMMYRADGAFDSVIRLEGINDVDRDPLPADFLKRVHEDELGLRPDASGVKVVVPWRKGDETLGYLASRLSADELHELCVETASRYLGTGGIIDVVDIRGNYVLSSVAGRSGTPDRNKTPFSMVKLAGQGGLTALEAGVVGDFNDAEGTARLGAVVSSAHLRWLVGASRPVKTAFASLRRVRLRVLLMSIIAALASGVVGLLMARQISGPVQRLVRSVRRAAKRGFTPETKVAASGELGQLASAFNHALSQMDQYRRQIRRTTQLRLRLARLAPDSASARELLARASTEIPSSPPQPMAVLYADVIFEDPKDTNSDHLVTLL
ncbi:MAG: HAMP domain-containing protein, partial [Myxococcota bacterium]